MLRLLDKKEIDQKKALELKRQQEEGIKIAKKVDRLRELFADTEASYKEYRDKALTQVQSEIDAKIVEKNELESILPVLRKEREKLEKPVDLTEVWEKVADDLLKNDSFALELAEQHRRLIIRESLASEREADIAERDELVKDRELLASADLRDARSAKEQALDMLSEAQNRTLEADKDIERRYMALQERELASATVEASLKLREEEALKEGQEIIKQKIFLADQRATLDRAMKRIKHA